MEKALSALLRNPNPIIRTENVPELEADLLLEFDFSTYVDALTHPVYPPSENDGVYLYWGFSDGGRGIYAQICRR